MQLTVIFAPSEESQDLLRIRTLYRKISEKTESITHYELDESLHVMTGESPSVKSILKTPDARTYRCTGICFILSILCTYGSVGDHAVIGPSVFIRDLCDQRSVPRIFELHAADGKDHGPCGQREIIVSCRCEHLP